MSLFVRNGKLHFSQMFLKQVAPIGIINNHFNQPFNIYNIRSRNHKDGSIVSYQLLFTKPRASNVFDQHCCKVAYTIHLNQLHVLCKELKIKWQCMCIITAQPICHYQDKKHWQITHISQWPLTPWLIVLPNFPFA
jgi:hypothetical protein